MMTVPQLARRWGLSWSTHVVRNIRTGKDVETSTIGGLDVRLPSSHYTTSIIEILNKNDEVIGLEYRGDKSPLHRPFNPEDDDETAMALEAVWGHPFTRRPDAGI